MSRREDLRVVEEAITRISRLALSRGAARIRAEQAQVAVSRPGIAILTALRKNPPLRSSALAEAVRLDAPLVSREVGLLGAAGLVTSETDPDDARARIVALTPEGRAQIDRYRSTTDAIVAGLFERWSGEELHELAGLLTRVAEDFGRVPAPTAGMSEKRA